MDNPFVDAITRSPAHALQSSPQLAELQRRFGASMARAQSISLAFQMVQTEYSNVFSYGQWKAVRSVEDANSLMQLAAMKGLLSVDSIGELEGMTTNYLRGMTAVQQAALHHLLQIANDVATGNVSPESMRAKIHRLITGVD